MLYNRKAGENTSPADGKIVHSMPSVKYHRSFVQQATAADRLNNLFYAGRGLRYKGPRCETGCQ